MFGNLIDNAVGKVGSRPAGGVARADPDGRCVMVPMLYYLRATKRPPRDGHERRRGGHALYGTPGLGECGDDPGDGGATRGASHGSSRPSRGAYLFWSIVPVLIADRSSRSTPGVPGARGRGSRSDGGTRTRCRLAAGTIRRCGTAMTSRRLRLSIITRHARGAARDARSRSGSTAGTAARRGLANFIMLFSFVVPEIILGVSLFLSFSYLLKSRPPTGDHGAGAGSGDVPAVVPVHHRPRSITHDRTRVRGSGDGPGRHTDPGAAARALAAALPGDPRERRAGLRRHGRRLRHRAVPVGSGGHRAAVGEDLLGRPLGTDAGGERRRHGHARRHAPRDLDGLGSCTSGFNRGERRGRGRGLRRASRSDRSARLGVVELGFDSGTGVPVSGNTRSASRGMCTATGVPDANGIAPPSFWIHAWMRCPGASVDEHLQDRADVDDALHHARDRGSRPSSPWPRRSTRSGRIVIFDAPRVSDSPSPAISANSPSVTRHPPVPCPSAVPSIRFDTPRKSATYAVRGSS